MLGVVSVVTSDSVRQAVGAVGQSQEGESCEAAVVSHVLVRCGVSVGLFALFYVYIYLKCVAV